MTLTTQALTMLHMLGAGLFLGTMWDTVSRLRWKGAKRVQVLIEDVLFWLLSGLLVFMWLKSVNEGNMRIYVLFSILCGYAFYQALIKVWYLKLLDILIRTISSIFRFVQRLVSILIITPLRWLMQTIVALLLFCLGLLSTCGRFIFLIAKRIVFFFLASSKGFLRWMANVVKRKKK